MATLEVRNHGAGKAVNAESGVRPVAGVFGGDQGVHDVCRNVAVRHVHAVVCVKEGAQKFFAIVIIDAGFARKHLQNGGAVELIVGVLCREYLEDHDIGGNATNEAD